MLLQMILPQTNFDSLNIASVVPQHNRSWQLVAVPAILFTLVLRRGVLAPAFLYFVMSIQESTVSDFITYVR